MNKKTILILLVILLIGGGQSFYFATVHKQNQSSVEDVRRDIAVKQQQLIQLQNQLKVLPQTKEELLKMEMKVSALINKIPSYGSSARDFSDIIRIMQTSNFADVRIKTEEVIEHAYQEKVCLECVYSLIYIAPFKQSRNFVNALNQSDQLLNVGSFKVDNTPQINEEKEMAYKYLYQEGFNELVQTELKFSAFVNPQRVEEEVYDPSSNILTNTNNAFFNVERLIKKQEDNVGKSLDLEEAKEVIMPLPVAQQKADTKFKISLSDILTSGDNYSFVGPSTLEETIYAGLEGHQDTYITLSIKSDGYSVVMETEDGQVAEKGESIPVDHPHVDVFSTMKPIAEEMPKIFIYIKNYTQDLATVRLDGSLLGNITIYNESDQEVKLGQTKGNIKVY